MVLGEIKPVGDVDIYSFQGSAGDVVMVSATETSGDSWYGLQVEVLDPQGASIGKANASLSHPVARTTATLATTGAYKILVQQPSARTGPYTLILKNIGPGGGTRIVYDDVMDARIEPQGDVDAYIFEAKAGDMAVVSAAETAGDSWYSLQIEIFDPQGNSLGKANASLSQPVARTTVKPATAGLYRIVVLQPSARIGPYVLILKNVA